MSQGHPWYHRGQMQGQSWCHGIRHRDIPGAAGSDAGTSLMPQGHPQCCGIRCRDIPGAVGSDRPHGGPFLLDTWFLPQGLSTSRLTLQNLESIYRNLLSKLFLKVFLSGSAYLLYERHYKIDLYADWKNADSGKILDDVKTAFRSDGVRKVSLQHSGDRGPRSSRCFPSHRGREKQGAWEAMTGCETLSLLAVPTYCSSRCEF